MKKIFLLSVLMVICLSNPTFSDDRISTTVTAYNATTLTETLVQRGDARLYSVEFVASANGGLYVIMDSLTNTASTGSFTDIKSEGKEATSLNSHFKDFSKNPLEFSTGLMIVVKDGTLILRYE